LKTFVTPFRVGLLVLAAVGFLLAFLLFVRRGTMGADTITVYAMFRDASGLGTRSRVQVAGIPVGEIRDISLVGTRARLTLRLRKDIGLRTDATLIKRTESFLGDYLLDLQVGSPNAPLMPDGGEITHVIDKSTRQSLSLEQLLEMIREAGRIPLERDALYNVVMPAAARPAASAVPA